MRKPLAVSAVTLGLLIAGDAMIATAQDFKDEPSFVKAGEV